MELDPIGNREPMPAQRHVVVLSDGVVSTYTESGCERGGDLSLQRVTGEITHLAADGLQALALALADFDRQQLEKMPVTVGRTGAGSLGAIEQSGCYIETNRAGTWCCSRGCVGGSDSCCVY